jgi:hypothetical protein
MRKIATGSAEGGKEAAEQGGGDGAEQRIEGDGPVEADFGGAGERVREKMEGTRGTGGDSESEKGAKEGEEENFGEELGDDGAARGSEGKTDGDFVLAVGGAGEQESGNVGTGDEQEEGDGSVEEPEGVADVGDDGFFEGRALDLEVSVGFGELFAKLGLDGGEVGLSLGKGNAGFHAADDAEPGGVATLRVGSIGRAGRPDVDFTIRKSE